MDDPAFEAFRRRQRNITENALRVTQFREALSIDAKKSRFPEFHQRKVNYKAGHQVESGALPLPTDIVMHESEAMSLSDGTVLYSDIFLPARFQDLSAYVEEKERVPAIVAWSPYGKQKGTTLLDDFPFRAGVPKHWLSGLHKWEGPDPAFWCPKEYAVVNVDSRGAFTSDGDLLIMGHQEAQDGAEFITWLSKQPWCNGKVGLTGNSWLAIAQWRIGGLRPEGLAALAPWEGFYDYYRQHMFSGGIYFPGFQDDIANTFASRGRLEDIVKYAEKNDLWDDYWEDKLAHPENIQVPTYVVSSWTNPIHTPGTLKAWAKLPDNTEKWLRVHNSMEWPDYYDDNSQRDLLRLFDYSLKGRTDNAWASTPRVRLSILHLGLTDRVDTVNRPESEFPLARTKYKKYYLQEDNSLSLTPCMTASVISYDSAAGKAVFCFHMPEDCETTGYFMAHLLLSTTDHSEMDVFVQVEKLSSAKYRQGVLTMRPQSAVIRRLLKFMHDWGVIGIGGTGLAVHWGPDGQLRASHALSKLESDSTIAEPVYAFSKKIPMKQGEKRFLDIPMRPYGMFWEKGDYLKFTVQGKSVNPFAIPGLRMHETDNKGLHFIHCGGEKENSSYLLVPHV